MPRSSAIWRASSGSTSWWTTKRPKPRLARCWCARTCFRRRRPRRASAAGNIRFFADPDQSRLDARLRPNLRPSPRTSRSRRRPAGRRGHRLAIQCLGQVQRLEARRARRRRDRQAPASSGVAAGSEDRWRAAPHRAGRRQHRRQRPRHAASPPKSACSAKCSSAIPGVSREHLEEVFADYLGIEKVIWLERGIAGDDTHGHVDDIARFVGARTVVTAYEPDPDDPNHEPLQRQFPLAEEEHRSVGQAAEGGEAAHARAGVFRRTAAARQLRQLLHRQQAGAGAGVRRSQRPRRARTRWPRCFPSARWSASIAATSSGDWARCTA